MQRIVTGTLPGFPPHQVVAMVAQELPIVEDDTITPIQFIIRNDPQRKAIEQRIEELESQDDNNVDVNIEEQANILSTLYEMLDDEGSATSKAVKALKEMGFR
jgi:hypothetical protein